jgi:outer membrane immunogenic protein
MKTFLLMTTVIATLAAGTASAADMPVYKGPVRTCAADQFGGGYVGINGGTVNWTANRTDQDEVLVDTATYVQKKWGGVIGGQIGYNWTSCNTVFGIEVDGDWSSARTTTQLIPNAPFFNINIDSRFDTLLTGRTRAGFVIDSMLFYFTGGIAAGHFKTSFTNQFLGVPGVVTGTLSQASFGDWRWGWVAGFGTEWVWSDRVSIRSEVLYVDFVDKDYRALFAAPATYASFKQSDSMWVSRIGINYRFGGGAAYAKY